MNRVFSSGLVYDPVSGALSEAAVRSSFGAVTAIGET